jgi:protein-tyrosine phosphatase
MTDEGHDARWVALDGAHNFRDLGGYAAGSSWVAAGVIFRSDALQLLSPRDLAVLERHHVHRVIDLRSPAEVDQVGRGDLGDGRVTYFSASILPSESGEASAAPPVDDVAERYLWYLDVGREAIVASFEILAAPEGGAVAFHCAAGKDRTGVLAALVLGALGVAADDIAADYALTNLVLPAILERLGRDPVHGETVRRIPASRRVVDGEVMLRFLATLTRRHGGAAAWAEQAGVGPETLAALRTKLLVPSAGKGQGQTGTGPSAA